MAAWMQATEVTLGFPTSSPDRIEEISLWGPETIRAMPGAAAFMAGEDAYGVIADLAVESGMLWDIGPYRQAVLDAIEELEDPKESIQDPEIEAALDLWRAGEDNMDDLHKPSYYLEWNQAEGAETWVGGAELGNSAKIQQYTPEMLEQREALNWMYNFEWNRAWEPASRSRQVTEKDMTIPDQTVTMELVAVGDNYAVAKCPYGAVYIPKGALKYLLDTGYLFGGGIGSQFKGHITFTPLQKFPWRLKKDGIIHSISECQDYYYDDY